MLSFVYTLHLLLLLLFPPITTAHIFSRLYCRPAVFSSCCPRSSPAVSYLSASGISLLTVPFSPYRISFILSSSSEIHQLFSLCCLKSLPAVRYFSWFTTSSRQRIIHLCSSSIPLHHDVAQRSRRTGREQRASRGRDSGCAYQRHYTDQFGCGIYLKNYLVPRGSPLSPPSFPPFSPSSLPPYIPASLPPLSSFFPPLALFLPHTYYVVDQSSRIKLPS